MIDNKYISLNEDYQQIYNMFDIRKIDIKNIVILNGFLNINDIYKLLIKELFLNPQYIKYLNYIIIKIIFIINFFIFLCDSLICINMY